MMFQTKEPDSDWMARLRERQFTADTVFPNRELEALKRRLLPYGGHAVILAHPEPHMAELMSRGHIECGADSVVVEMTRSACHSNAHAIWKVSPHKAQIWTGWALSEDGCWRQHSWAKVEGQRVETTVPRLAYFGFGLTEEEAKGFCP